MNGREREVGGVTCSRVLAGLDDFVDDRLAPEDLARVRAHLAGCDACASFGKGYAAIVVQLRRLPEGDLDPGVATRLRNRLRRV